MKFIEPVNLLGTPDRLAELERDQPSDDDIPEEQAEKEGGESGAQGSEGNILEDIQALIDRVAVKVVSELGEVVEHD
jgi:hypothetical protein